MCISFISGYILCSNDKFSAVLFEMLTEKEENEYVSSSYCCPYLTKVHQQILLYPSRDKEKSVYTVSKFYYTRPGIRKC